MLLSRNRSDVVLVPLVVLNNIVWTTGVYFILFKENSYLIWERADIKDMALQRHAAFFHQKC